MSENRSWKTMDNVSDNANIYGDDWEGTDNIPKRSVIVDLDKAFSGVGRKIRLPKRQLVGIAEKCRD